MKMGMSALAALSLALPAQAVAASTKSAPTTSPSIAGRWALDLSSMPVPPEQRPAGVTVDFAEGGAGWWTTTYVITAADGGERRMTSRERLNGQAVAIDGDQLEADSVAMSSPAPGVIVMGLAKSGRPGSVRVYTVLAGGAAMVEHAASVGDDGQPVIRTFRWQRQAGR